ncbi:hypothetical protein [Sulfurimonas sp. HSL3-7]|uniref:hypothetical protein n=1 Tax=Sulfonitrofixus jiaomeiensis TaxID=3131938 RepID=UPI0031F95263
MKILLPMDSDDTQEGQVVEINYFDTKEDVDDWVDAVVVIGNFEPVMEFIEQQMMVLVAHTKRSIDDIVEAFLFKELHDLAI